MVNFSHFQSVFFILLVKLIMKGVFMEWFLKARHWQIFLFIFIIPLGLLISGLVLTKYYFNPGILFFLYPLSIVFGQVTTYLWMWMVGSTLHKKNPGLRKPDIFIFRLFILVPLILAALVLAFWLYGATVFSLGSFSIADILYASLMVILPLQFLVIISMFYCFLFVAKIIKMVDESRVVVFDEYFTEFIFVIFLPLGIWFLQPRVNKLNAN